MPPQIAWHRLGNVLLLFLLAFISAQIFDWTPGLSAGSGGARADLAPSSPATTILGPPDTTEITQWNTTISTPGNYVLKQDLRGKSGCGVTVAASNVNINGKNRTVTGDSRYGADDTDGGEHGICAGSGVSGVIVQGVIFQGLDYGVAGQTGAPTTGPIAIRNNRFLNLPNKGVGIDWWIQAPNGLLTLFTAWANYFRGGAYGIDISNFGRVGKATVTQNTYDGVQTAFMYYGDRESPSDAPSSADTVDFKHNVSSNGQDGVSVHFSSGRAGSFQIQDNRFDAVNYPVSVYSSSSSETMGGVDVAGNNIKGARNPIWIAGSGQVKGVAIKNNYIQGPVSPTVDYPAIGLYGGGTDIAVQGNYIDGGANSAGMYFTGGATAAPKPFFGLSILQNVIRNLIAPGAKGIYFRNLANTDPGAASAANLATNPAAPLVRGNSFIGNAGPGITYTLGTVNPLPNIDASGNWWGDPAGPNGPNGDGVGANVVVNDWLTVEPQPALAVTKSPSAASVRPGEPLTYTIVVRNDGAGLAGDLHVVDQVTGAAIVGHTGFPAVTGSQALWQHAVLAPGERITYTLSVVAPSTGTIRNTVTVTATQGISATTSVEVSATTSRPTFLPLLLRQ